MIEEENALLRKEVNEKSEVIAQWIRSLPDSNHSVQLGVSSPGKELICFSSCSVMVDSCLRDFFYFCLCSRAFSSHA